MIIPALDLLNGRVVRLRRGDYAERSDFDVDPAARIRSARAQGARLVHLVDLQGARDPVRAQRSLIRRLVRGSPLPVQTGGGIRSAFDIRNLLDLGVERVVIGSAAVRAPELTASWLRRFGPGHFTLALDVRLVDNVPRVATHGWRRTSDLTLETVLRRYLPYKIRHLLVTDIGRDGMLQGPNVSLYAALARSYPGLEIIASGGVSSLEDLRALSRSGAAAAVVGRALLERRFTVREAVKCWPDA